MSVMITRRDLLKILLASAAAESVDFERLLWTPKPIITVPAMPREVCVYVAKASENMRFRLLSVGVVGYDARQTIVPVKAVQLEANDRIIVRLSPPKPDRFEVNLSWIEEPAE